MILLSYPCTHVLCPLQSHCSTAQCRAAQSVSAGLAGFCWAAGVLSCPRQGGNSGLVKVVVVVMVFMVVVVLMPLHHLRQPPLVEQHAGQIPHLLLLHHWSWSCQRA